MVVAMVFGILAVIGIFVIAILIIGGIKNAYERKKDKGG